MSWKRLLAWFKNKPRSRYHSLDHKLVKTTQASFIPRLSQFKYLGHFLNSAEKRVMWVAGLIALVSGITSLVLLVSLHLILIPKEGGEYHEAMIGQPKLINPLYAGLSDVDTDLTSLLFAGLFRFNVDQKIEPYLAESYTVSADQKTYDVKLRSNLVWSDGEPLTVDDVMFTFELIQNQEVGSPLAPAFEGVTVTKSDDTHMRFALKEPFAPFITSLTVGILPAHIWGEIPATNIKLARQNLQPIGAGAWQFSKLFKNETGQIASYELTRNDHYFAEKPFIKTVKFTFFNEYREAVEAMRTHNDMGLSFIPHTLEEKLNKRTVTTYPIRLPQYTTLFFNQAEAPSLKNSDIRQALAMAIDKNRIVNEALHGYGSTIETPILEGSIGYDPNGKKTETSVDKANELLDKKWSRIQPEEYFNAMHKVLLENNAADLKIFKETNSTTPDKILEYENLLNEDISAEIRKNMDPAQTFYRKTSDSKAPALEVTITTVDTPEYSKTAELVSEMWQAAGVKTNIQKINSQQIIREIIKKRNYEILLYGEIIGYDPDPYPFWHSSQVDYPGLNLAGYANRNADKTLEEGRITTDDKKRDELYKKFQEHLLADIPAIFLYSPLHTMAISHEVKGVNIKNINNPADRFTALPAWYVKTKWQWKL